MWFEELVGFKEENPQHVRDNIKVVGNRLVSNVNDREFVFGELETPSLEELRVQSKELGMELEQYGSQIMISELVGDIMEIHKESSNNNSVVQVASQFNLLEMAGPRMIPEDGVGIYSLDKTQGPACAIACGAGTIYRNYFANVNGRVGQSANNQIDCLKDIGAQLQNDKYGYWEMKNGYALASREGLQQINKQLRALSEGDYENLKGKLRIGVQWGSEVTISNNNNRITQVYCSALPVAYSEIERELWSDFAKLILEATYEATLFVALKNYEKTGNNKVFLTLVGGGVFGNEWEWIFNAIKKAIIKFGKTPLDIKIVSHKFSNSYVQQFIDSL